MDGQEEHGASEFLAPPPMDSAWLQSTPAAQMSAESYLSANQYMGASWTSQPSASLYLGEAQPSTLAQLSSAGLEASHALGSDRPWVMQPYSTFTVIPASQGEFVFRPPPVHQASPGAPTSADAMLPPSDFSGLGLVENASFASENPHGVAKRARGVTTDRIEARMGNLVAAVSRAGTTASADVQTPTRGASIVPTHTLVDVSAPAVAREAPSPPDVAGPVGDSGASDPALVPSFASKRSPCFPSLAENLWYRMALRIRPKISMRKVGRQRGAEVLVPTIAQRTKDVSARSDAGDASDSGRIPHRGRTKDSGSRTLEIFVRRDVVAYVARTVPSSLRDERLAHGSKKARGPASSSSATETRDDVNAKLFLRALKAGYLCVSIVGVNSIGPSRSHPEATGCMYQTVEALKEAGVCEGDIDWATKDSCNSLDEYDRQDLVQSRLYSQHWPVRPLEIEEVGIMTEDGGNPLIDLFSRSSFPRCHVVSAPRWVVPGTETDDLLPVSGIQEAMAQKQVDAASPLYSRVRTLRERQAATDGHSKDLHLAVSIRLVISDTLPVSLTGMYAFMLGIWDPRTITLEVVPPEDTPSPVRRQKRQRELSLESTPSEAISRMSETSDVQPPPPQLSNEPPLDSVSRAHPPPSLVAASLSEPFSLVALDPSPRNIPGVAARSNVVHPSRALLKEVFPAFLRLAHEFEQRAARVQATTAATPQQ
jgi:hypothetical protein